MFSATDRGHTEIVKLLLENGANFMISTEAGLHGTALHSAAAKGRLECVRWSIFFFKSINIFIEILLE
jgi:ankyrin repeat protein